MRTLKAHCVVVSFLCSLVLKVVSVHSQNLERANREGEVVWYTPTAIEDSQKMIQAFEKKTSRHQSQSLSQSRDRVAAAYFQREAVGPSDCRCNHVEGDRLLSTVEAELDPTLCIAGEQGLPKRLQRP
jgi:hypothetical protein